MKLSTKQLWHDTAILYQEYEKEDKSAYARLFSQYFDGVDGYIIHSHPIPKLSWCVHDIIIELDCYNKPISTFFSSIFPMDEYSQELRNDPIIRKFTKLCFYIQENIEPYSSALISE